MILRVYLLGYQILPVLSMCVPYPLLEGYCPPLSSLSSSSRSRLRLGSLEKLRGHSTWRVVHTLPRPSTGRSFTAMALICLARSAGFDAGKFHPYDSRRSLLPEWRNWQTRGTQNPVALWVVWVRLPPLAPDPSRRGRSVFGRKGMTFLMKRHPLPLGSA